MIKINLLQTPRVRKGGRGQVDVRVEAAGGLALVGLVVGLCFYYSGTLGDRIAALESGIQKKTQEVAVLKRKAKKVEDFEKKKELLEKKSKIIDDLEKSRTGPVKVLDSISVSLDPLKLWLVKLGVKGKKVTLEGRAMENDDVVGFVNNLRKGDVFTNIDLLEIRSKMEAKVKIFEFKLKMDMKDT